MQENSELILAHPKDYLSLKKQQLDKELDEIKLPDDDIIKIRNSHAMKVLTDDVLGKLPAFKFAKRLLLWNKEVNADIKSAKKEMLLVTCCEKINTQGKSIDTIRNFITNPSGSTLFNKILQIIDDSPPDTELIDHLSSTLLYIAQSEFERLFNDHKYALSQIQLMTPHSLTILSDSKNWPIYNPGSFQANGHVISSDWLEAFSSAYIQSKRVNLETQKLIKHCVNELISKRFVISVLTQENKARVQLTEIGETILKYIKS